MDYALQIPPHSRQETQLYKEYKRNPGAALCISDLVANFLLLILISILIVSCSSPRPKGIADSSGDGHSKPLDTVRIGQIRIANPSEYLKVLDTLDCGDLSSLYVASILYKNCLADSLTCDSLFADYYDFLKRVADGYLENNQKAGMDLLHSPSSEATDQLRSSLLTYGIQLDSSDGQYSLMPDNTSLLLRFGDGLSMAYRKFLLLRSDEVRKIRESALLNFDFRDSLVTRIMVWENFILQFPSFISIRDAQEQYSQLLGNLLAGTSYSVVFDPDTDLLNDSTKVFFESFILKNPESASAGVVKAYLDMLKTDHFRYSEKVDSFLLRKVFAVEPPVGLN